MNDQVPFNHRGYFYPILRSMCLSLQSSRDLSGARLPDIAQRVAPTPNS